MLGVVGANEVELAELDREILAARYRVREGIEDFRTKHTTRNSQFEVESLSEGLLEKMQMTRLEAEDEPEKPQI